MKLNRKNLEKAKVIEKVKILSWMEYADSVWFFSYKKRQRFQNYNMSKEDVDYDKYLKTTEEFSLNYNNYKEINYNWIKIYILKDNWKKVVLLIWWLIKLFIKRTIKSKTKIRIWYKRININDNLWN